MKRSDLKTVLVLVLVLFSASLRGQNTILPQCDDNVVEKVKTAMLCMQRHSWEQGTAMQGMLQIGDTTCLILMARESVQGSNPDGRLSMV